MINYSVTLLIISTCLVTQSAASIGETNVCLNPYVDKDYLLQHPDVIKDIGGFCNYLKYGSCCTKNYLKTEIETKYNEYKDSLMANFTLMVNHYTKWMSVIDTFEDMGTD